MPGAGGDGLQESSRVILCKLINPQPAGRRIMSTISFSASILSADGWKRYADPGLFEVDARARLKATRTRHDARAVYRGEVVGENHALVRAATGRWKAPARRAWQEPTGVEIGAEVTVIARDGTEIAAQVWSLAPGGGVWLATAAGGYLWAHPKSGDVSGGYAGRLRSGA